MKKTALGIASVFLIIAILSSVLIPSKGESKKAYWYEEPKVNYQKQPNLTPIIARAKRDQVDLKYRLVTWSLAPLKKENKDIVVTYVNPINNTVFIKVYQLSDFKKQTILDSIDQVEGVKVIFKNSEVTSDDLYNWKRTIWDHEELLELLGVDVAETAISANGTIAIGIRNLDEAKVETFKTVMKDKIPLGLIVLHKSNVVGRGFLDQDEHHNTMIGGLQITSYNEGRAQWVASTLGWYVSWYDSGWKEGILMAGHAASDDSTARKRIYQPDRSQTSYNVATFVKWGNGNPDTADVALCQLKSIEDGKPEIWKSSGWDKIVYGEGSTSSLSVNDYVEITGITSGQDPDAQIVALSYDIDSWDYPYTNGLDDLVKVTPDWAPGDSGAPVYQKWPDQQAEEYMIYAFGIVTGGLFDSETQEHLNDVYSSRENIEDMLNENLDFITDR